MNRFIFLGTLILCACQSQATQLQIESNDVAANLQEVSNRQAVTQDFLISPKGIGQAELGMTLGQLKQRVDRNTEFDLISPFTSEFNAIAVTRQGLVQYYILFAMESDSESEQFAPTDEDLITLLLTSNYSYRTREGINVGTSIEEAEDLYGNAVLAYNIDGESVEYIFFGDYEPPNVRFRASYFKLISDGLGLAGIYPQYPGVAYTTDKYQPESAIAAIEVACDQDTCPE
ncbi:MAG: hypothetical protein AAFR63_09620 [Cyanobacteria bacterium J06631_6]